MIHFLRVHPGWAWVFGSVALAGLFLIGGWVRAWRRNRHVDYETDYYQDNEWFEPELTVRIEEPYARYDDLGPEEQADQLIHEWHDDPADVTQPWSLLDEWWADLDGLERECELLHMSTREQDRAWAELIEETRALCPLAV